MKSRLLMSLLAITLVYTVQAMDMGPICLVENLDSQVIQAATEGNLDMMKALRKKAANFKAQDEVHKATALHWVITQCEG